MNNTESARKQRAVVVVAKPRVTFLQLPSDIVWLIYQSLPQKDRDAFIIACRMIAVMHPDAIGFAYPSPGCEDIKLTHWQPPDNNIICITREKRCHCCFPIPSSVNYDAGATIAMRHSRCLPELRNTDTRREGFTYDDLYMAIGYRSFACFRYIYRHGCVRALSDPRRQSILCECLETAIDCGCGRIAQYLIKRGARIVGCPRYYSVDGEDDLERISGNETSARCMRLVRRAQGADWNPNHWCAVVEKNIQFTLFECVCNGEPDAIIRGEVDFSNQVYRRVAASYAYLIRHATKFFPQTAICVAASLGNDRMMCDALRFGDVDPCDLWFEMGVAARMGWVKCMWILYRYGVEVTPNVRALADASGNRSCMRLARILCPR